MNRTILAGFFLFSGLALCLGVSVAHAQLIQRRVLRAPPVQASPPVAAAPVATLHDTFLANWIGIDNQTEISLNQFAVQKAASQDVKDFAQEMIRAHSDLATKLNQTITHLNASTMPRMGTPRMGRTPYTVGYRGQSETAPAAPAAVPAPPPAGTTDNPPRTGSAPTTETPPAATPGVPSGPIPEQPSGNPAQHSPAPGGIDRSPSGQLGSAATIPDGPMVSTAAPGSNAVAFKRDINSQLVALVEQKLGQKTGQEFDRCYLQGQIAAHVHILATLDAARAQASPQLKPVLDEAADVAQKHLAHAETLLGKLQPQAAK